MLAAIINVGICYLLPSYFLNPAVVNFNIALFVLSIALYIRYGEGDFSKVKRSGKFQVGFKETFSGNQAVSVFYPMDKSDRK